MSLEQKIAECNAKGWIVLGLCQIGVNEWTCKVQSGAHIQLADAKTPLQALTSAMANMRTVIPKKVDTLTAEQEDRLGRAITRLLYAL